MRQNLLDDRCESHALPEPLPRLGVSRKACRLAHDSLIGDSKPRSTFEPLFIAPACNIRQPLTHSAVNIVSGGDHARIPSCGDLLSGTFVVHVESGFINKLRRTLEKLGFFAFTIKLLHGGGSLGKKKDSAGRDFPRPRGVLIAIPFAKETSADLARAQCAPVVRTPGVKDGRQQIHTHRAAKQISIPDHHRRFCI